MPSKDRSFHHLFLYQDELSPLMVSKHSAGNNKSIHDKEIKIWSTNGFPEKKICYSYYHIHELASNLLQQINHVKNAGCSSVKTSNIQQGVTLSVLIFSNFCRN